MRQRPCDFFLSAPPLLDHLGDLTKSGARFPSVPPPAGSGGPCQPTCWSLSVPGTERIKGFAGLPLVAVSQRLVSPWLSWGSAVGLVCSWVSESTAGSAPALPVRLLLQPPGASVLWLLGGFPGDCLCSSLGGGCSWGSPPGIPVFWVSDLWLLRPSIEHSYGETLYKHALS